MLSLQNIYKRRITHLVITLFLVQGAFAQEGVILSAGEISERGIVDISDLTTVVPGLYVTTMGSAQNTAVYLRGVGSRAAEPAVGLYVDDMPWLDKSSFCSKISEIERIEVLRGAQNTLYGRNAIGGVIRVVTRNPIDCQGTYVERSMANHTAHFTGITHYHPFSEKSGFSAGVAYRSGGQYFRHALTGAKVDADRSLRAHARLSYRPSEKVNLDFLANYELCSQDAFPFFLVSVPEGDPYKGQLTQSVGKISGNCDNLYLRHLLNVGMKAVCSGEKVMLSNVFSFQLLNDELESDADFTHLDLGSYRQTQQNRSLSDRLMLKSRPGAWRHWEWTSGADFYYQWQHVLYDTPSFGASLYHQSSLRDVFNARGWSVTMGLRCDYSHVAFLGDGKGWWHLLPCFSLQRSFGIGNVYGTVSRGNRSGGYSWQLSDVPSACLYAPETSWNYEVGTHLVPIKDRLYVDASVFFTSISDLQIVQRGGSGMEWIATSAGRSGSYGGDFSLRAKLTGRIQADAGYSYTHATFADCVLSPGVSCQGNYVPFVPQHTMNLGLGYGLPLPEILNRQLLDKMKISVRWHGYGRMYWTEDNSVSEPFCNALDAKVSFFRKHLQFGVWANNIFDKRWHTCYFQHLGRGFAQLNKPFQCGFEIKLLFK